MIPAPATPRNNTLTSLPLTGPLTRPCFFTQIRPPCVKGAAERKRDWGIVRASNNPSVNASRCHLPLHRGGFSLCPRTYIFVILQKIHTCLLTILTKMVECSLVNIPDNFIPYQEWRRERPNEATATCFSRCQIRRESKDEERARKFSTLSVQAGRFFVAYFRK